MLAGWLAGGDNRGQSLFGTDEFGSCKGSVCVRVAGPGPVCHSGTRTFFWQVLTFGQRCVGELWRRYPSSVMTQELEDSVVLVPVCTNFTDVVHILGSFLRLCTIHPGSAARVPRTTWLQKSLVVTLRGDEAACSCLAFFCTHEHSRSVLMIRPRPVICANPTSPVWSCVHCKAPWIRRSG